MQDRPAVCVFSHNKVLHKIKSLIVSPHPPSSYTDWSSATSFKRYNCDPVKWQASTQMIEHPLGSQWTLAWKNTPTTTVACCHYCSTNEFFHVPQGLLRWKQNECVPHAPALTECQKLSLKPKEAINKLSFTCLRNILWLYRTKHFILLRSIYLQRMSMSWAWSILKNHKTK